MKRSIAAVSFLSLAALASGCEEDRCDVALATIEDKASDCSLPYADQIDAGEGTCDESDASDLERQADCTEAATCAALDGSDTAGNRAYSECVAGR